LSDVTNLISREELLRRGVRGGAVLAVAGTALGVLAESASAAPLSTDDLAYARLLVGVELLASNFYSQAIAASNASSSVMEYLKRAYFNEQEHYQSVTGILSGSGNTPAVSGDVTFSYPSGTFASEEAIVKGAVALEGSVLGTYLGAVGNMDTDIFNTGFAQIAACEAQHLSYFTSRMGGKAFNLSFPPALTMQQASDAMDAYTT
jgi:Ferritin-like domain